MFSFFAIYDAEWLIAEYQYTKKPFKIRIAYLRSYLYI